MNRSDPEYRLSIEERKATAVSQFERGAISEAVFRASLFAAGMRGEAIDVEVRLHGLPAPMGEVIRRFVSGLQ